MLLGLGGKSAIGHVAFILTDPGIPVHIQSPNSNCLVRLPWGGRVEEAVSLAHVGRNTALAVILQIPFNVAGTDAAPRVEWQVRRYDVSYLENLAVALASWRSSSTSAVSRGLLRNVRFH